MKRAGTRNVFFFTWPNMSLSTSSIEILLNARETRSVNCSNDCLVISSVL